MARNCEPEIREHVAMRARRRAEIQKREGTPVARATSPHYTNIQNVRFPAFRMVQLSDLPAHRQPVSLPPKSLKVPTTSIMSLFVRMLGRRSRKHPSRCTGVRFSLILR